MPNSLEAIIWTNADPIHSRIYAALGGDKLTPFDHSFLLSHMNHMDDFELGAIKQPFDILCISERKLFWDLSMIYKFSTLPITTYIILSILEALGAEIL